MPDFLSMVERGLKAVRFGIFQASDNLAMLLDGLCRAPEEPQEYAEFCYGTVPLYDSTPWPPDSAAASPAAAVVAPSPKQGSDSGPAAIDAFPRVPAGPHLITELERLRDIAHQAGCKAGTPLDRAGSYRAGQCAAYSQALALLNSPPK